MKCDTSHSLHNFPCPIKHFQSAIYNICLLFWLWCKVYHCQDNYSEMNKLIVILKQNLNFTGRLDNHNGIGELTFLSHGSWDFCFYVCNHMINKIQVTKNSNKITVFSRSMFFFQRKYCLTHWNWFHKLSDSYLS